MLLSHDAYLWLKVEVQNVLWSVFWYWHLWHLDFNLVIIMWCLLLLCLLLHPWYLLVWVPHVFIHVVLYWYLWCMFSCLFLWCLLLVHWCCLKLFLLNYILSCCNVVCGVLIYWFWYFYLCFITTRYSLWFLELLTSDLLTHWTLVSNLLLSFLWPFRECFSMCWQNRITYVNMQTELRLCKISSQ